MTTFEKVLQKSKEDGRSLASVSLEAGLSRDTVLKWKESDPTAKNLKAVADVLNVPITELIGD